MKNNRKMESEPLVKIGVFNVKISSPGYFAEKSEDFDFLKEKTNFIGRIAITLAEYLVMFSKKFDKAAFFMTSELDGFYENGTLKGIIGGINRSELDIGVLPIIMSHRAMETVDFTYPYRVMYNTFITRKAEYQPQMFGILKTFTSSMWIAIISIMIALSLVYYIAFKRKYPFQKTLLQTFAVLLRQSSILTPSSLFENLLIYSWVVGAMFICLAYDSAFLSFLAILPVNQVKDVSQLAKALEKGEFHCVAEPVTGFPKALLMSNLKNLRIMGQDMVENNLHTRDFSKYFFTKAGEKNIALLEEESQAETFKEIGFISEDRFYGRLSAMMVRKDFCCKKMLDMFVHRLMASGLYFKYRDDAAFFTRLEVLMNQPKRDVSKRILTLTDVAPAFIVLLSGYFISFLVLIGETVFGRRIKKSYLENNKRGKKSIICIRDSV